MSEFHFIRPLGLFALLPLVLVMWHVCRQTAAPQGWQKVCDSHLLPYLIQQKKHNTRYGPLMLFFLSAFCMIIALAGPTWSRYPVPTYKSMQARVLVLDLSDAMRSNDLKPNRLSRAKFKIHDILNYSDIGQLGLVVYSGEPFVVSPLTDDGHTIDALLSSLTPDILPVKGHQLGTALEEAGKLIQQAGFHQGDILVFSAHAPSAASIEMARMLAKDGIHTSMMPMQAEKTVNPLVQQLVTEGQGDLLLLSDKSNDLEQWFVSSGRHRQFDLNAMDDIPVWHDQGRWFLVPALILLLPAFRRGWLQRVSV